MSKLDHLYVQLINDGWVADRPRLQIQLDGGGAAGGCSDTGRLLREGALLNEGTGPVVHRVSGPGRFCPARGAFREGGPGTLSIPGTARAGHTPVPQISCRNVNVWTNLSASFTTDVYLPYLS